MSENPEIRGLASIVELTNLHGIEEPSEDATPEEYDAWWVRVHCWHVEIKETTDGHS